jgi:8-oxo-dGTP diphosphatase
MEISKEDKKFLELYSDSSYEKPSITVDNVIFRFFDKDCENYRKLPQKRLQVYLIKRKYSPYKDDYALPGTFINLNESLTDSMKMCLKNKVNIDNFYYEQLYTFGEKKRDPRTRVISIAYLILTNNEKNLCNGEWFDIEYNEDETKQEITKNGYIQTKSIKITLKNDNLLLNNELIVKFEKKGKEQLKSINIIKSDLSFDHIKILFFGLERLKNKLEYTDIVFNLIQEKFTLTELKLCYESILGKKLLDANFRRKVNNMVSPITDYDSKKGHRPSRLFVHNKLWELNNIE